MPFFRRRRKQEEAFKGDITSQPPDARFVAVDGETLVYTAPSTLPAGHGTAPSGTLKIALKPHHVPGFVPTPTCIELSYDIPRGQQESYHPHPGVTYPSTTRCAFLPNNHDGCKLLMRFKVAWTRGHLFKIGKSLTSGLDDQVCWSTVPNKTSLRGGPFGFPDSSYITKANAEFDKLGIPCAEQCLALLSSPPRFDVAPPTSPLPPPVPLPPAQNPSYVPSASTPTAPGTAVSQAPMAAIPPPSSMAPTTSAASSPATPLSAPALADAPAASVPVVSATALSSAPTLAPAAACQDPDTVSFEQVFYSAPSSLACTVKQEMLEPVTGDDECVICLEKVCQEESVKIKACQHEFHLSCLQDSLEHNPRCPVCRTPLENARGKSPSGTMKIEMSDEECPGFGPNVKAIRITYDIPGGVQKEYHENPNQTYSGTTRVAYLPNTTEGRKLLKRFKFAFKQGLTFRVGRSLTTGLPNQVTWTSIHHKTSLWGGAHGFPDSSYMDNVNASLDALHVPENPADYS